MFPTVVTNNPSAVAAEVQAAFLACEPEADPLFVPRAFSWANDCFTGRHKDYQAIDARYHDFEHTLQATLCLARLLRGRRLAGAAPLLNQHFVQLAILAILLHDTGYLKLRTDTEGTGAKYTAIHVARSAEFAADLLARQGYANEDIQAVQNMIRCTGIDAAVTGLPFRSEEERIAGCAVGTADLLGQLAAADYVDRLPALYAEFAEATRGLAPGDHSVPRFDNVEALMRNTPIFWKDYVLMKLNGDFGGLYRFLNQPYPDGPNEYVERIEANLARIKRELAHL
ncbi:MAG: HD domain-containing protein [Verrucomicrobiae bacterium]|nr:HD domain-containing protein [Verrucomicrobiae bacterium]